MTQQEASKLAENNFNTLYKKYNIALRISVHRIFKNKTLADEAVNYVFAEIWKNRGIGGRFESDGSNMGPYLRRAVINRANGLFHKYHVRTRRLMCLDSFDTDIVQEREISQGLNQFMEIPPELTLPDFFNDMVKAEVYKKLKTHIESLPAQCRTILKLFYFGQYKSPEIAKMLGLKKSTVRNQCTRGLQLLRVRMRDISVILIFFLLLFWIG